MAIRRLSKASITSGAKSSKMWDQETSLGFYESIATAVVDSSGASSITFSNIPQYYTHLQIRASVLSNAPYLHLRYNGNTDGFYSNHQIYGTGSSTGYYGAGSANFIFCIQVGNTDYPAASIIDVLDYTNTNKTKSTRILTGLDNNGSGEIYYRSGAYHNSTAAITSLTLTASSSTISQHSQFSLYGIRGA